MSDDKKRSHWDDLAAGLGATPPPAEPPRTTPEKTEPATSGPQPQESHRATEPGQRAVPSRRPAAKRAASAWNDLASQLGVAVPDLPARPKEPPPAPDVAPPTPVEAPAKDTAEPRAATDDASPRTPGDARDAAREAKPAKKRRRRRSRAPGARPAAVEEAPLADDAPVVETVNDAERDDEGGSSPAEAEGADEPSTGRTKRRRRRRPGRKKAAGDAAAGPEPIESTERTEAGSGKAAAPEDRPAEDDLDDADDFDEARPRGTKKLPPSHRGLPSWDETIGVVIAANMEARAKRPAVGGSAHPRGGNRRRNGRDKSGPSRAKSN